MKKSIQHTLLCAVAVAAACASSGALAQSSVSLYGRIDLGLRYDSAQMGSKTRMATATYNALGLKGSEDLGGGNKVFFQMEHRFDASTGRQMSSNAFYDELAVVGVQGQWGTLRMGRSDGPFALAADADAFGGDYVGGRGERRAGANDKFTHGLMYWTPEVAGFQAVVGTALVDPATEGGVHMKHPVAATVLYHNNKLTASLGYMQRANEDKAYGGSLTYDFGAVQTFFTAAYNDGKGLNSYSTGKRTDYDVGVAIPVSAVGSVRAKYNYDKHLDIVTHNVGLGYWHQLSPRTHLYVTGNHEKADHQGSERALDVGMVHNF